MGNPFVEQNENYKDELFKVLTNVKCIDNVDKDGKEVEETIYDEDEEEDGEEGGEFDDEEGEEFDEDDDLEGEEFDDDGEEDDEDDEKPNKRQKK